MATVKLEEFQFKIPEDIIKKAHIQKDQELIIETTSDNTIQIKPMPSNDDADDRLLQLLNNPEDMGNILCKDRSDVYDDIN